MEPAICLDARRAAPSEFRGHRAPGQRPAGASPVLSQGVRRPLDALTRVTPRLRVIAERLKPPATLAIGAIAALAVIGMAALSAVLGVITARDACSGAGIEATPSAGVQQAGSPPAT